MISENKIRVMTELAMFSQREQRGAMAACRYRRRDFITISLFKVWAALTSAYMLATALVVLYLVGTNDNAAFQLKQTTWNVILWAAVYVAITVVFLVAAYVISNRYYTEAVSRMRPYCRKMQKLKAICQEDSDQSQEIDRS